MEVSYLDVWAWDVGGRVEGECGGMLPIVVRRTARFECRRGRLDKMGR